MTPEFIFCAGGNVSHGQLCLEHGFLYCTKLPCTTYDFPVYFADQDWKKPNRARYMAALAEKQPHWATVLDLERVEQYKEVMSWAEEACLYVKIGVIIIPKVNNVIPDIPHWIGDKKIRLGYSVPTRYGGTTVPLSEFKDRPVHLLGGSPQKQYELANKLCVESLDNNYIQYMATKHSSYFSHIPIRHARNRNFPQLKEVLNHFKRPPAYHALDLSFMNIKLMWAKQDFAVRFPQSVYVKGYETYTREGITKQHRFRPA